jgi:tetratricopeptide (TPR) repeat protein
VLAGGSFDIPSALGALDADALRALFLEALAALELGPRTQLEDALLRHAVKAGGGWRPEVPAPQIVEQAQSFVASAARDRSEADPAEVDFYLREGVKASLAGDHETARVILGAVLPPIATGAIYLGQEEMVDDVLSVDLHDCVVRYVAAVYHTTPTAGRADAVFDALHAAPRLTYVHEPLAAMERATIAPLPDVDAFLPAWQARLERASAGPGDTWETDEERWLREAVGRHGGIAGLERLAKATKQPEAVRSWCEAVLATGDLARALVTYEEAARLVPSAPGVGALLDAAAFLAFALTRDDAPARFEAAWRGAPSLRRLLRWLLVDAPSANAIRVRAEAVRKAAPSLSPYLQGALHILRGDIDAAAALLAKAPGLGWSRGEHPGYLLFAAFTWLLGGAPEGSLRAEAITAIARPAADLFDAAEPTANETVAMNARPRALDLTRPSFLYALLRAEVAQSLTPDGRRAAQAALRAAAIARVEGVVEKTRRNHYGHAARLVACCVELESKGQKTITPAPWVEGLRQRTRRYPSFQAALQDALERARA